MYFTEAPHTSQHNDIMLTVRQVIQHLLSVIPDKLCSTLDITLRCVPEIYFCVNTRILVSNSNLILQVFFVSPSLHIDSV